MRSDYKISISKEKERRCIRLDIQSKIQETGQDI